MSLDYYSTLLVGYHFSEYEIEALFQKRTPAQTHTEERYDSKTGAKLGLVVVTDKESQTYYALAGEEFGRYEFYEAVSASLDCAWAEMIFQDKRHVGFGIMLKRCDARAHLGVVTVSGNYLYEDVVNAKDRVEKLGQALTQLGFRGAVPKVFSAVHYI